MKKTLFLLSFVLAAFAACNRNSPSTATPAPYVTNIPGIGLAEIYPDDDDEEYSTDPVIEYY